VARRSQVDLADGSRDLNTEENRSRQPLVTIGLPVYNGAEFIEQALASITQQTHGNWRLLVSDNASTDGTWDILERCASRDDRILLHRQETNIGATLNYRYLLDRAETEYFMWHAYDDWIAPNYLEELVRITSSTPDCALACPKAVWTSREGEAFREVVFPDLGSERRVVRVIRLLKNRESTRIYGLFRPQALRRAYENAEKFGYIWAGDHVALLPFILNDRIRGTNRTTFHWRKTHVSYSTLRPATHAEQRRFFGRYLRFHMRALCESELELGERLVCLPWLLSHAAATAGFSVLECFLPFRFVHRLRHPRKHIHKPIKRWLKSLAAGRN
jgi:glycosyltransferase involved in cell wall biosynthesis